MHPGVVSLVTVDFDTLNRVAVSVAEMKNEKSEESMSIVDNGTLIKQEPSDRDLMKTWENVYDSQFDVFEEEVSSNSSQMVSFCENIVNTPFTALSFKEEIAELEQQQELSELDETNIEMSVKHNNKLEHSHFLSNLPTDCTQTLGASSPNDYTTTKEMSMNKAYSLKENLDSKQQKCNLTKAVTGTHMKRDCLKSHNNIKSKYFFCDLCSYKSVYKVNLERHIQNHNRVKILSLTCKICKHKFTHKGNLKRHMKTHSGEKPFSCDVCGYKFFWKFRLKNHMRSHTDEKPFSCYICGNKFTTKSNLMVHIKKHSGERPFCCDICDKKYLTKSSLGVHMRSHTGEKPFFCLKCNYKCAYKSALTLHMKAHTGDII